LKRILQITPFVLFIFLIFVVVFILRYEEPYPAIYQPAFAYASNTPGNIHTRISTIEISYSNGCTTNASYSTIFPFAPSNRGTFLFETLEELDNKDFNTKSSFLKKIILDDYKNHKILNRDKELYSFKKYLKKIAPENCSGTPISYKFSLYDVSANLKENEIDTLLNKEKIIRLR